MGEMWVVLPCECEMCIYKAPNWSLDKYWICDDTNLCPYSTVFVVNMLFKNLHSCVCGIVFIHVLIRVYCTYPASLTRQL